MRVVICGLCVAGCDLQVVSCRLCFAGCAVCCVLRVVLCVACCAARGRPAVPLLGGVPGEAGLGHDVLEAGVVGEEESQVCGQDTVSDVAQHLHTATGPMTVRSEGGRQTDRQTDRRPARQTDGPPDRQTARQTDRRTDRRPARQTAGQTDRHRQRGRDRSGTFKIKHPFQIL